MKRHFIKRDNLVVQLSNSISFLTGKEDFFFQRLKMKEREVMKNLNNLGIINFCTLACSLTFCVVTRNAPTSAFIYFSPLTFQVHFWFLLTSRWIFVEVVMVSRKFLIEIGTHRSTTTSTHTHVMVKSFEFCFKDDLHVARSLSNWKRTRWLVNSTRA